MSWPPEIQSVYLLCNPQKERVRFQRLVAHLLQVGVPKERVRVCGPTWGTDLSASQVLGLYDPFLPRGSVPTLCFKAQCLSLGEISLCLNFFAGIRAAIAEKGVGDDDRVLFLESDVYLRADFVPRLSELLADASGVEWDFISLGEGCRTRPPEAVGASFYGPTKAWKPPHACVFRCTDSMLFRVGFLKRLVDVFLPFKECLDWELNFKFAALRGRALWADPPLAEQGTLCGRMRTSLPA